MRFVLSTLAGLIFLTGCGVGPGTIPRDRFNYGDAISRSWKQQTLLNIVKLRYLDSPTFLSVDRVINQYNLEGTARASGNFLVNGFWGETFNAFAQTNYYDRPTITYTPLKGDRFTRDILTPVPPQGILALTQSGWQPSVLFHLAVESINGITQTTTDDQGRPIENPDFGQLVADLDALQEQQVLSIRVIRKGGQQSLVMIFMPNGHRPLMEDRIARVYDALKIDPNVEEFTVIFGALNRNEQEIAIQTRSIFGMMTGLAGYVDVPEQHLADGWVTPGFHDDGGGATDLGPLFKIRSSKIPPLGAYVKVQYEGNWFWIDKGDLHSKQLLAALMMVATVAESPHSATPPFLTIPAGG